jgi:hypothetical protein
MTSRCLIALAICSTFIESTLCDSIESSVHYLQDQPESNLRGASAGPRKLRYTSGSSKKGGSIGGFIAGIILWCLIPPCLWNNERIAIKQAKIQSKARHATVIAENYQVEPIAALEGHILFVSGETSVDETLKDKYFPSVTAKGCIKLRRVVQMYQWVEEEKKEKRGDEEITVYTYKMLWKDSPQKCEHDSDGTHANPPMTLPSSKRAKEAYQAWAAMTNGNGEECAEAKDVKFGKYYCGDYVTREFTNWKATTVDESMLSSLTDREVKSKGGPKKTTEGDDSTQTWYVYGSGSTLGDYRVRFEQLECGPLSVNGCLAKTTKGYTFVPIIHEDSSMSESIVTEFGCDDCCAGEASVEYTGPEQQQDTGFMQRLEAIGGPEMKQNEMQQFQRMQSSADVKDYTDDPQKGDLCCTCCIPQEVITKSMHYIGLEEEYLGVKEQIVRHKDMMGQEKAAADLRHNICRIVGLLGGVLGALLIISPITNFLTSNFFIAILGGAFLSCALQLMACCCSSISVTLIISAAWVRHRPRLVFVVLLAVLSIWGGFIALSRGEGGASPTVAPGGVAAAPTGYQAGAASMAAATLAPTMAPAKGAMMSSDGGSSGSSATAGTCGTYTASCPPGYSKNPSSTTCSVSPCAWHDCCASAKLKRRLNTFSAGQNAEH